MKAFFLSFTVILFFSATAQKNTTPNYFEGIVEYEIKSLSYMQGVSDNEIRERSGSVMRLYFKNGSYMREYLDESGYVLRKMFYLKETNMMYDHNPMSSPDTMFFVSSAKETFKGYAINETTSEKVLDCECPGYTIKAKYVFSFMPDTGNVTMTYFFCPRLPVDPEWHKGQYIWKEVIRSGKSIAVKFIEDDLMFYKQTYTATKITWQKLDDSIFKIDPKLVLKEMPDL